MNTYLATSNVIPDAANFFSEGRKKLVQNKNSDCDVMNEVLKSVFH